MSQLTAMRAAQAAAQPGTPPAFIRFYTSLARKIELDSPNTAWNASRKQLVEYQLFLHYQNLKNRADKHDPIILAFLKQKG